MAFFTRYPTFVSLSMQTGNSNGWLAEWDLGWVLRIVRAFVCTCVDLCLSVRYSTVCIRDLDNLTKVV